MNFIFCHNLTVTTRGTERVTVKIGSYINYGGQELCHL